MRGHFNDIEHDDRWGLDVPEDDDPLEPPTRTCRHREWKAVREDCGGRSHYCRACGIDAMDLTEAEAEAIEARPERERGEDDGREYGHPREALAGLDF